MIKVVHFDYQRFFSVEIRDFLKSTFEDNPDVDYYDFEPIDGSFSASRESLEAILPEKDVLLIHPGVNGQQNIVMEYPSRFPNLSVALLIPGDFSMYVSTREVRLFGYKNRAEIVRYILEVGKKKSGNN